MINISIDTNKISKDRIKKHTNGSNYLNITVDKLKEPGRFGETHCVYESQTKEERTAKAKRNYIGNGKEIIFGGQSAAPAQATTYEKPKGKTEYEQVPDNNNGNVIDDLPF